MHIRVGYELQYDFPQPTPIIANHTGDGNIRPYFAISNVARETRTATSAASTRNSTPGKA